jgi:peptidoglycan/xylan/chitin deacetylase (PgdA/CDA1 family)
VNALFPTVAPVMLVYHRVCADADDPRSEFVVPRSVFREQMRALSCGPYLTPRLSEVLSGAPNPRSPEHTPVVVTFDDGFADTLEHALPVLKEFGIPAAVFPVLDLNRRYSAWDSAPEMRAPLLEPEDMRAMEDAGVEFGSHTVAHTRLTRALPGALEDELVRSREILAAIVARPLPVLAYPYGDVDERVKDAARRAGYAAGLAVASGPLDLSSDPFEIRRQCVAPSSSDAYLRLLFSGALKLYAWSKWKVRTGVESVSPWRPT